MTAALVAALFAGIGLLLTIWLAGPSWGLIFPVLLPAAVPLYTQRKETQRAAAAVAKSLTSAAEAVQASATAAAADIANLADRAAKAVNAPHEADLPPTHSLLVRSAITLLLLGATVVLASIQVITRQASGWWLVAASVLLVALFAYIARQWCGRKSKARVAAMGLAAWALGLGGNFTASAITGDVCADNAQRLLERPLNPIADGVAYLVGWTGLKDQRDAALAARLAKMDAKLDELGSHFSATSSDGATTQPLAFSENEIATLEQIKSEGPPIQQARAVILLAADSRSKSLWAEADRFIVRIEVDRQRGLWKSPAEEERYLLLKGDRLFYEGRCNEALPKYQSVVAEFPNSVTGWHGLGRSHECSTSGGSRPNAQYAIEAYKQALRAEAGDSRAAALLNDLAHSQLDAGDRQGAFENAATGPNRDREVPFASCRKPTSVSAAISC